jgi:hypothetical protein
LTQKKAHVQPLNPIFWDSSANPSESSVLLNHESPEFIRFVNPGDLRTADKACGPCHKESVDHVSTSMMRHGAMLWGAALYNNGADPHKNYRFGQAYGADGVPLRLKNPTPVTPEDTRQHGILPFLDPLPRFPLSQPSNILRIFEKGGEKQLQLGNPTPTEPPGKPLRRLSERGLGTLTLGGTAIPLTPGASNDPMTVPFLSSWTIEGARTQQSATWISASSSRFVRSFGRLYTQTLSSLSTASPVTPPIFHLFGRGFGQPGSY